MQHTYLKTIQSEFKKERKWMREGIVGGLKKKGTRRNEKRSMSEGRGKEEGKRKD